MAYQERVDIDRLYDLIYDAQSEQLRVVTREEFEELVGNLPTYGSPGIDFSGYYYDKSEIDEFLNNLKDEVINLILDSSPVTFSIDWQDENNQDGVRPVNANVTIVIPQYYFFKKVQLTPLNDWQVTLNIPSDVEYEFRFPTNFLGYTTYQKNDHTVTYTYNPSTTDVTASVTGEATSWKVKLYKDSVLYDTKTVTGRYSWTDLPKYKNPTGETDSQSLCVYTVGADGDATHDITVTGSADQGFVVNVENSGEYGSLSIEGSVINDGSQYGRNLDFLEFNVWKGDELIDTFYYSDMTNDTYSYPNIRTGEVTVNSPNCEELLPDAELLDSSVTTMTGTIVEGETTNLSLFFNYYNAHQDDPDPPTQSLTVNAVWNDENNVDGFRPSSVVAHIYLVNDEVLRATLNSSNNWTYTWTDLPVANYKLRVSTLDKYTVSVKGMTVTYDYVRPTTDRFLQIVWNDNDDAQKIRPTQVTATIGEYKLYLNDNNNWMSGVTGLPVYKDGQVIDYEWSFQNVPYYTMDAPSTSGNLTTITYSIVSNE